MIRRSFLFFSLLFLFTCDDGDIITIDLEFDKQLELCSNFEDFHLVFDTRNDPNEALILIFPKNEENDALFTTPTSEPVEFTLNGNTNRFIYRSYNRSVNNADLCTVIPPGDLTITQDNETDSGTVVVTTTAIDDDNDGIPSADEYGAGGLENPQDTDLDGIPDYLDEDDDNDNVKTSVEIENGDDGNPLTDPLDTDNDGIPNYFDLDDDGDGIPTRLEDENGINGPVDDTASNSDGNIVPHYLNNLENISYSFDDYNIPNSFTRNVTTQFTITNFNLGPVSSDIIDLGTFESTFIISTN